MSKIATIKTRKTTKTIKKQLAVAVTAALLVLPLGTTLALAETAAPVQTSTTTDTTNPDISSTDTANTNTTSADTEETLVVDTKGDEVNPANWLSDLIGKLQMALTFDLVRKGELSERQALAKLAKAQKLMTEGKSEESQIALGEYTNEITKAQEFLEQVDDSDSEKAKNLTIALTNVNQNNIEVLGNLLDKLPPQAAQKLALNVVRSMEKAVTKLEKRSAKVAMVTASETASPVTSQERTPETDSKSLEKQAKVALKEFKKSLKQKGNLHLEDDEDQDLEDQEEEDQDDEDNDNNVASTQEPSMTNSQPTSVTIAPAKHQPAPASVRSSEQGKEGRKKHDKDKGGD